MNGRHFWPIYHANQLQGRDRRVVERTSHKVNSEGNRVLQASVCHRALPINLYDLVQGSMYISLKTPFCPRLIVSELLLLMRKVEERREGGQCSFLKGNFIAISTVQAEYLNM